MAGRELWCGELHLEQLDEFIRRQWARDAPRRPAGEDHEARRAFDKSLGVVEITEHTFERGASIEASLKAGSIEALLHRDSNQRNRTSSRAQSVARSNSRFRIPQ